MFNLRHFGARYFKARHFLPTGTDDPIALSAIGKFTFVKDKIVTIYNESKIVMDFTKQKLR